MNGAGALDTYVELVAWAIEGLGATASNPDSYASWARILAFGGLPTALLALPVFFVARRRGLRRAAWIVLAPLAAVLLAFLATPWIAPALADGDRFAFGFGLLLATGFATLLWLPIAAAAAVLGAWSRRRREPAAPRGMV